MHQSFGFGLVLAGALQITACAIQGDAGEDVGESPQALQNQNALNANALNANALNANALNANALNANALNANALNANALSAIQQPGPAGDLSRRLVEYTVGCALDPTQSFRFSYLDEEGELREVTYRGLLGLAPGWATGPLDVAGAQWVSACLASRVNWYGVSVTLSSRGAHPMLAEPSPEERTTFTREEGAFWGNLFSAAPALYACYNAANRAHSRSRLRDCAAGHVDATGQVVECGMIEIVGPCSEHCSALTAGGSYRPACTSALDLGGLSLPGSMTWSRPITVFLE